MNNPLLLVAAAVAAVFFLTTLVFFFGKRSALAQAAFLEGELEKLRSLPLEREFRVELFDCVWYPKVTADLKAKKVLKAAPGLPHCGQDKAPLRHNEQGEGWKCVKCGKPYPEFADASVRDSVVHAAVAWFRERHPDFS